MTPPRLPPLSAKISACTQAAALWLRRHGLALPMIILLAASIAGVFASLVLPGPGRERQTVLLPTGSDTAAMAERLTQAGVLYHPWQLSLPALLLGSQGLKPGEYALRPHASALDVLLLLHSGRMIVHKMIIPEGLTNAEIARLLTAEPILTGDLGPLPEEGRLFPATYDFSYGDTRRNLLKTMQRLADETLRQEWHTREPSLALQTPEQALILASIIEKETGVADERARIAGVFLNRLRLGMKLQSDPTVIYALTRGTTLLKRGLTVADLAVASPYNTYVTPGLPPGPIANPGRAALQAVLHPERHDYLYFVADGSGGHAFAATLAQHNRNVRHWRQLSRN